MSSVVVMELTLIDVLITGSLMTFDFFSARNIYVSIKHPVCNFLQGY